MVLIIRKLTKGAKPLYRALESINGAVFLRQLMRRLAAGLHGLHNLPVFTLLVDLLAVDGYFYMCHFRSVFRLDFPVIFQFDEVCPLSETLSFQYNVRDLCPK